MGFLSNAFSNVGNFFSGLFSGGSKAKPEDIGLPSIGSYRPLSSAEANPFEGFNLGSVAKNFAPSVAQYTTDRNSPGGIFSKALTNFSNFAPSIAAYGTPGVDNEPLASPGPAASGGASNWFENMLDSARQGVGDLRQTVKRANEGALLSDPLYPAPVATASTAPVMSTFAQRPDIVADTAFAPLSSSELPGVGLGMESLGQGLGQPTLQQASAEGGANPFSQVWDFLNRDNREGDNQSSIMDSFMKMVPQVGMGLIGNLLSPDVAAPDTSGIYNELMSRMPGGSQANPATQEAINYMLGNVRSDPSVPPDSAFTAGDIYNDEQLQKDLKNFDNYWKAIRPNADYTSDTEYQKQRAEIIERARERRTAARDELSFQYNREQEAQRYNSALSLLNLDQAQMNYYVQLAQLPLEQLMIQTGIDAQTAQEFKDMFGNWGEFVTADQMGLLNQQEV